MAETAQQKLTVKVFINKVLAGTATGVIVALIGNAIFGALFEMLGKHSNVFMQLHYSLKHMQYLLPVLVGVLIGLQFGFNGMQTTLVGVATFLGSGAAELVENAYTFAGIGDLINVMLTASIAVLVILWIGNKLGSLTIILLPIIVGGG